MIDDIFNIKRASAQSWDNFRKVSEPALAIASVAFLADLRASQAATGIIRAVADHDTGPIFEWIMGLVPLQGISDQIAARYAERHGSVAHSEILMALTADPSCPRLSSYWHFEECGYHKIG